MSALDLQQVMSSRFRTSIEADKITNVLMGHLGLSIRAHVARLAIGRSLALGSLSDEGLDAKGNEIPASTLFTGDDIGVWAGLLITHSLTHGGEAADSMEGFRAAIRRHWHRGAHLLLSDWQESGQDFDKFLETLIVRRADLPDSVGSRGSRSENTGEREKPQDVSALLVKALTDIGVSGEVKGLVHGPRVTRYKIYLADINQLDKLRRGLERLGLALNLQKAQPTLTHGDEAKTVSLDVPRPRSTWTSVGISEFRTWLAAAPAQADQLLVFPGVDVLGNPYSFDLAAAPHLLVGGTTGSGKSVCLHALMLSLIVGLPPTALKLALIDPKQVEFSVYAGSEYLYSGEVANTPAKAREMLSELVVEMEARYTSFSAAGVSNIHEARKKRINLPYIAVFIEELADLLFADKNIEEFIVRLAQKARAAGIHLVLATQRPDAKTFSGLVRSNIPARIALTVQKSTESKIILDDSGAELLLGLGDMLIKAKPGGDAERAHGVRLDREDIVAILRERTNR
jgi:S-DNA-T family DNA segregation ATPase FtsK/SpoIIIE